MSNAGPVLEQMVQRGLQLFSAGRYGDAEGVLSSLGGSGIEHPGAHFLEALLLYQRKDHAQALGRLKRALALAPSLGAFGLMGVLLRALGRSQEGERAYRRDLVLRPDYLPTLTNLANVFIQAGRFAEAAKVCRVVIALSPSHDQMWARLSHCLLRETSPDAGAMSEPMIRRAVVLTPHDTDVLKRLALICIRLKRPEPAAAALRLILQNEPHCGQSLTRLAQISGELGALSKMVAGYRRGFICDAEAALRVNFPS